MEILIAAVVLVAVAFLLSRHGNELLCVEVRAGRVRRVRGRAPVALMDDFTVILKAVPDATVRVVVENRKPAVRARGRVGPDEMQRLRNVVGRYTTAQMRTKR
jgi:hypothetical protein